MNLRKTAAILATVGLTTLASALAMSLCSYPIDPGTVGYTREAYATETPLSRYPELGVLEVAQNGTGHWPTTLRLFNDCSVTPCRHWGGNWPSGFLIR